MPSALRVLRRRLWIVVVCAVVAPAAALAFSLTQEKQYSASASLLFREPDFDQTVLGAPFFTPARDPAREAATNVKLVSLDVVSDRTAARLRNDMRAQARTLTGSGVSDKVEVSQQGNSDLVSVKATDASPALAARIANTFAEEYIRFRREADRAKIEEAQRLTERQLNALPEPARSGQRGRLLRERVDQLDTLAALQTGNAELVQPARVPSFPSSPRPVRDTALALVLGLVLGLSLAFLLDRLDRRLRDPREVEETFARPILGAIPHSRAIARRGVARAPLPVSEAESFRMLRANLRYFNVDHDVRSVLVTSAAPGDGKTTVAHNLAAAAAGAGSRVLLVEADLRHPVVAAALGIKGSPGLTNILAGDRRMEEVIQNVPVLDRANGQRPARTMDVIVSGPLPPNPGDLIESERLRQLIAAVKSKYDLVVIDTPPTSVVSDAIPLVKEVNGVIVVTRLGKSTRDSLVHLRNQLENLNAPTLGVVVNSIGRRADSYAYGYAYGYGYGDPAEPIPAGDLDGDVATATPSGTESPGAAGPEPAPEEDSPTANNAGNGAAREPEPAAASGRRGFLRRRRSSGD